MEQSYNPNAGSTNGGMPPMAQPPKNWLVEAILVTVFCCLPFGIVGIVKAAEVNSKFAAGNYAGALESSQSAGKWTKIGFFVAIGGFVIWGVLMALGIGAGMMSGLPNAD